MVEELKATELSAVFQRERSRTEYLCQPLTAEDCCMQSMKDVSPPKWHLAHTTWFFENFVLVPNAASYPLFDPRYSFLFNSYYETLGEFLQKSSRGNLSRPPLEDILNYRKSVTAKILELIAIADERRLTEIAPTILLGIHHEQQHQELLLMDIKHIFASNPLRPHYVPPKYQGSEIDVLWDLSWTSYAKELVEIGYDGVGFCFDNEKPSHSVLVEDFRLASRLVTNGEYLQFILDGGYSRPEFWLSDGWNEVRKEGWFAPLYWQKSGNNFQVMKLSGLQKMHENEPVCHVSYYESDAFARWSGKRLPTEMEWEVASRSLAIDGNFLENEIFHPIALRSSSKEQQGPSQLFGDVWEWTASAYLPYPGYRPLAGSLGEYNGKFMCNQMVLRGGSAVTLRDHMRATYRNFYPPASRWQFSGLRLAEDA